MDLLPSFIDQLEDLETVKHKSKSQNGVQKVKFRVKEIARYPLVFGLALVNRSSSRKNYKMSAFTPYSQPSNPPFEQTNMTEAGLVNQRLAMINQQQATLYPQQFNAPYSLPTPSGPLQNEIRAVNGVFHRRWTNHLPYGAAHLRPQGPPQLLNQPQQLSQVLLWNAHEPADLSGSLQHQRGEEVIQSTQVLESSIIQRVQHFEDGQINQAQVMPFVLHPHQSNQYLSAMASRPQEVGGQHQQSTHVQMVPNVVANSMVPKSSMFPRFPPVQLEEFTVGVNTTPSDGTSQQGTPEKRVCKRRATSAQGRESGESSRKSSKRQRNSANSNDREVSVPSNPREVINGCYNPIYDNMGLPLDPHLRLLEASLKREFPSE